MFKDRIHLNWPVAAFLRSTNHTNEHERNSRNGNYRTMNGSQRISGWRGWVPIIVLPVGVLVLTPVEWPRWVFMWLLSFVIFAGCKWLTWRRTPVPEAPWWRHAGYLFAWPGLNPKAFLSTARLPEKDRPQTREWINAAIRLLIGSGLFWGVSGWIPREQPILAGWVGMVGLILMLHFGAFHLLSCGWRSVGVDAQPLMKRPLASTSVSEFWGRRWNTAFRDFTHRFLFSPLKSWFGPRRAIFAGFVFSGLVHELVISVPAGGGYGWPTLFFGIQAVGMFAERSGAGRAIGLGQGWRGRMFAWFILALPALGLFHPPFVGNVIVPFMEALGAH
jgi:Membrane bound O-acyl transferase family